MNILVLGISGMLGSMVFDYLSKNDLIHVFGTMRQTESDTNPDHIFQFDASEPEKLNSIISKTRPGYIINCIGIIKPYCKDNDPDGIYAAIKVNACFPYKLNEIAHTINPEIKIIQIATDCVYDGKKGEYTEADLHNPLDVYGKSKSLGEVIDPYFLNIRCSIIGPELKNKASLMEWFLSHNNHLEVFGFEHHYWNGVTTLQFAQLMEYIILKDKFTEYRKPNHVIHFIKNQRVTKNELLHIFNHVFQRKIAIKATSEISEPIDRTLDSVFMQPERHEMKKAITELYQYIKESNLYHD